MTLDKILISMLDYGIPSLNYSSFSGKNGWRASIAMNVVAKGVDFKVASEFHHKTPIDAAFECLSRAKDAVQKSSQIHNLAIRAAA